TPEGHALGTLCVVDRVPRELEDWQLAALKALARQGGAPLQLRRRLERERKQTQQTLLGEESGIDLLAHQMPAVLWSTDRDLRITSSMGRALKAMGQSSDQVVGLTLFEYFQTKNPEFPPLAAHRQALLGESVRFEVEWLGRIFAAHVEPLRNPDRTIKGVIGVALDITARKRAENELRRSVALLPATLDSTADGILVIDEAGKISDFNRSFTELWGVPDSIVASRDGAELLAFLLNQVTDQGRFAKRLMGLHTRSDSPLTDSVELKDGRR